MKISKVLFKKMERLCYLQNKIREIESKVEMKLESLGVNMEKARNDGSFIVDFINYGNYISKEEIEKELSKFKEAGDLE